MSAVLVQPERSGDIGDRDWRIAKQLPGLFSGESAWAAPLAHTGLDDDSAYAMTLRNQGSGGALNVQGSGGTSVLQVVDSGAVLTGSLAVSTSITAGTTIAATGTITSSSTVQGTRLISTVATGTGLSPLIVSSTVKVDNLNADLLDGLNGDAFVLRAGDTMTGALTMEIGGAGNDQAINLKHNSGAGKFSIGASNAADPVMVFKDNSGDQTFEVGNSAGVYQAVVTGAANVTTDLVVGDDVTIAGDVSAARGVIGSTTFSGGEELRVVGQTRLEGATEITTGGMSVVGGAIIDTVSLNGTNTVFSLIGTTQTQSTVGAAGGSSALPANPSAYLKIVVGATNYVIPFYNA